MRACWALLLAAAIAPAQEEPPASPRPESPAHDALGFPVTMNGRILTQSDVFRILGASAASLPAAGELRDQQLRNARDLVLRRQLVERIGEVFAIKISPKEVSDILGRQTEARGGEAKFYEWMSQQGFTLAAYQEQLRFSLLEGRINELLARGRARDGKVLAYDTGWRPRELERAFALSSPRTEGSVKVRALDFTVDLTREERMAVVRESMAEEKGPGWSEEEIGRRVAVRLAEVQAALGGGKAFLEIAQERGADLAQADRWVALPPEPSPDPLLAFLQQAAAGARSAPIPIPGGGFRLALLLERKVENPPSLQDSALMIDLAEKIRRARRDKAYALMLLNALDRSFVRPDRVREDLRRSILADLDQARQALAALGLP
ncbi:MAG: hypothetical protein ACT4PV_03105 [Planctomycetaceae bacterium]